MPYPQVLHHIDAFTQRKRTVSIDFEFPASWEPSIVGLSAGDLPVSVYYDNAAREVLDRLDRGLAVWSGHNVLTVEKRILEKELGREIPLDRLEDTMLRHYLCNPELCKGTGKDEDDEDPRGQGYMDLWSMASLYTDLPQWKECRGVRCEGPCRHHDVLGYNGVDAYAPDVALPLLKAEMSEKGISETLYGHLKKLTILCDRMQRQGIAINRSYVNDLEKEFEERKQSFFGTHLETRTGKKGQALKTKVRVWNSPFNPRSPKQVIEWFGDHHVPLESTEKEEIQKALHHYDRDDVVRDWLEKLYDYKNAGKGLGPWMDEKYFGADGLMHPRFIVTGTSMGRLASSGPNFQNIPRVGWGKKVRAAIIPRDPGLILVKADKSQLELRMCLWYAGVPLPKDDAFTWLVAHSEGYFDQVARENPDKGWTPREWAKSVSHGGDYGEGVKVFYSKDLDQSRTKKAIEAGALVVHRDWPYHGGVVGFTGVNLAERLFGSASWENRKKALQIQEAYFARFSAIRDWQKSVSASAEKGYVKSVSGRYLTLLGGPEDKFKMALACYGQGGGADDVQEAMVRYYEMGSTPLIQVHDELVFEFPVATTDAQLLDFFRVMSAPSKFMPGFSCPVKVSKGPNWLDMQEIGKV